MRFPPFYLGFAVLFSLVTRLTIYLLKVLYPIIDEGPETWEEITLLMFYPGLLIVNLTISC